MENIDTSRMTFLQNVLQYTTANTAVSGETGGGGEKPAPVELTQDKKEFLEQVLSSKAISPIEEMKKCIHCLYNETESDEKKLEALETLRDWCEDINFAMDFHKIDSYKLLPIITSHKFDDLRALAFDLIATIAQNNEYCQKTLIQHNILPLVFEKLEHDTVENVRVKALYAISCLIRDSTEAQAEFLKSNGCSVLKRTIELPIEKLQVKSCFLISSIAKNLAIKLELTKLCIIENLINMYRLSQLNIHEYVLAAIISLIDDNPEAITQAKHMNLDFKNIIAQRMTIIESDPRHLEEKENAMFLMESLFKN